MAISQTSRRKPNLDSVTTINEDGSRYYLHPADVRGRFARLRAVTAWILLGIYVLLPWIQINGNPAVLLDVANRRFHIFGFTFLPQDIWLLFFVITGLAFSLFYVTALFGRIWCGWTCPYTVFLEQLYRKVERWIDGPAHQRKKLDSAPWTASKIGKRTLKHGLFLLISAALAHVFLSYFIRIPELYQMMSGSPFDHLKSFGIVAFITFSLYFAFSWFREQFCIILCPYGRIQSALTDPHTMVIGYDSNRGEPRGKKTDTSAGDCINCNRCVEVCPTGIDIRDGLQIECIGCAACVDACDEIMAKVDRPKGLVRYDSEIGLKGGRTSWIRPRTILYTGMLILGIVVMSVSLLKNAPITAELIRLPGRSYYLSEDAIRNQFRFNITSKTMEPASYSIHLSGAPKQVRFSGNNENFVIHPMEEKSFTALIEIPKDNYSGRFDFQIEVRSAEGQPVKNANATFLGPNPVALRKTLHPSTP